MPYSGSLLKQRTQVQQANLGTAIPKLACIKVHNFIPVEFDI